MSDARVIFLSHVLSPLTPGFGGQSAFEASSVKCMERGDSCNQSHWHLSNHIGTHVDVPFHFSSKGATVDEFGAQAWIFSKVYLASLDFAKAELIEPTDWVQLIPLACELLLIRTGMERVRSEKSYWAENPGFSPRLGEWLRTHRPNVRAVGFDSISATSFAYRVEGREAHKAFLDPERWGRPLLIIEDMALACLERAPHEVIIAPLRVERADGAPVTVIAKI